MSCLPPQVESAELRSIKLCAAQDYDEEKKDCAPGKGLVGPGIEFANTVVKKVYGRGSPCMVLQRATPASVGADGLARERTVIYRGYFLGARLVAEPKGGWDRTSDCCGGEIDNQAVAVVQNEELKDSRPRVDRVMDGEGL